MTKTMLETASVVALGSVTEERDAVKAAFQEVQSSFENFCLLAGIEAFQDLLEEEAADLCGERHQRHEDRRFLETAQQGMVEWWTLIEERGTRPDIPMKPQVVAWELGKRLRDDAIVCADSGTIATWWARQIRVKRGQMYSLSGTLASMCR